MVLGEGAFPCVGDCAIGKSGKRHARKQVVMRVDIAGKRAIVTGASQGIGRGVFEVFAQLGVRCVTAARRKNILEEHAKYVISTGGVAPVPIEVDLFHAVAAAYLFEQAENALGGVDILVNAAGRSKAPDAPRQTSFNHPVNYGRKSYTLITWF